MARKQVTIETAPRPRRLRAFVLPALAAVFLTLSILVAFHMWEAFLIEDPRFVPRRPLLGQTTSPDLVVTGVTRTPPGLINAAFAGDFGRSVYLLPLSQRQDQLTSIEWVEAATVTRVWPNRIQVRISERTPVAFVQVAAEKGQPPPPVRMIDTYGTFLNPVENLPAELPVLIGIRQNHDRSQRAERVALMRRLLEELGPNGKAISEIDVSEPANLKVVYPVGSRALTLILGNELWKERMEKFRKHYPEIQRRMPDAIKLDLRIKDRITATEVEEAGGGE